MRLKTIVFGFGLVLVWQVFAVLLASPAAQASCEFGLPTDKGQASAQVSVSQTGQYTVWMRIWSPSAGSNSVAVQIDDQCPVVTGDGESAPGFHWVNYQNGDIARPNRWNLEEGIHTLTVAGRETGAGVDKVMLVSDPACIPVDSGQNCLASPGNSGTTNVSAASAKKSAAAPAETRWWVIAACLIVAVGTLAFLVWRFRRHTANHIPAPLTGGVVAGSATKGLRARLLQFWEHDKFVIFVGAAIILATIIAGVTLAANDPKSEFEAEAATLSGGAKIIENPDAIGGKYVSFEPNPPGTSSSDGSGGSNGGGGGTTAQNGGSTGGGGSSGGTETPEGEEEEPTPPGQCPAFPAFPDDSCTGWQHTGVTLQTCTEGDADEGDGHLEVANVTYDGCDFTEGAVVHSPNVTIQRSRIQGVVSAHWSTDYDFQNLTLIDVEIIAATPQQIADKNMVNNGGGSAINGANVMCIRCRIHYVPTGISLGNGSIIRDSYISDVTWGPGAHQAAIGAGGNSGHNSSIIHNRLDCSRWNTAAPGFQQGCSSALSLYDEPTLDNVLVKNNIFDTAGGYCTYGGGPMGTNIRYIDNKFGKKYHASCGSFGPVSAFYIGNTGNAWTNNIWWDDSSAISP